VIHGMPRLSHRAGSGLRWRCDQNRALRAGQHGLPCVTGHNGALRAANPMGRPYPGRQDAADRIRRHLYWPYANLRVASVTCQGTLQNGRNAYWQWLQDSPNPSGQCGGYFTRRPTLSLVLPNTSVAPMRVQHEVSSVAT
jgi:hypothetical protein